MVSASQTAASRHDLTVLHVGKFYPPTPGGMERVVQILSETREDGIRNRVLVSHTSSRTRRESWRGVPVTRVGAIAFIGSAGVCPTFPLELARTARDLTVIHEPNPLALASDWVAAQRGPTIVWFHSEVFRPRWKYHLLYRPFLQRVLKRAVAIVVASPRMAALAEQLEGFRDKCVVIPYGIETDRFEMTDRLRELASGVRRQFSGPLLLFLGRLVAYKGIDVLIRAMADVDATALVVGDGPLREQLAKEAGRYRVAHKVRFLGNLSDEQVVAHLYGSDVFVLPSVTAAEAFGLVQLEAMACGKPVVSTDLSSGVPWVNQHRRTGIVVPPGDAAALAGALNELVADPDLRKTMGSAGRERVQQEFTAERMRSRAATLYHDVLAAHRGARPLVHSRCAVSTEQDLA